MSTETQRCGRLDPHRPHEWPSRPLGANWPVRIQSCPGKVTIEGGEWCEFCQGPIAVCRCYAQLIEERRREWYS